MNACKLTYCKVEAGKVYAATVENIQHHPFPILFVKIPDVGVRGIWYTSQAPPAKGSEVRVKWEQKSGWKLENKK